jgi:glucose 1-dehydrogenase
MRLRDRIAIVTGSDSGIGQAIAEEFAREGADVAVVFHTDAEGAEETRRRVEAAGRRAIVQQADVGDPASVESLFARTRNGLGVPDLLVNNAGIGGPGKLVAETEPEEWDRVIRTDLRGPFLCCRAFLRMRGQGGRIINITSVHEAIPSPDQAAYGAAKGGLLTFTRSLALECAPRRTNVNAIAPGQIRTPMTEPRVSQPGVRERELANIPWHRAGEPWEVARLAVYLASDDADYVTGQSFTIDGGLEMNWGQGA